MKKSKLFRTSLKFLGHIVSATGVHVDPDNIEAVQNFPAPTNLKALQRFLGMAWWYHRFVPNFSQIAEPLNALKKKGAKFSWSPACQTAFITLKNHLAKPPVLGHPNINLPFVVYTNASEIGQGCACPKIQLWNRGSPPNPAHDSSDPDSDQLCQESGDAGSSGAKSYPD
ncbi:hypothetical protein D5F01_LYC11356 [Larimichthys crocea]|uniref:Reverse transcriptase/retrotransposon-derived protein RNase H-like domain-containing protein n=1 Tax=Larimichthys crocea TaxID=215358 RepID=A0A6G0IDY6_LARCR|nr:hypothetical protein D5F01_LYC11356 [Larimichthys crocea]